MSIADHPPCVHVGDALHTEIISRWKSLKRGRLLDGELAKATIIELNAQQVARRTPYVRGSDRARGLILAEVTRPATRHQVEVAALVKLRLREEELLVHRVECIKRRPLSNGVVHRASIASRRWRDMERSKQGPGDYQASTVLRHLIISHVHLANSDEIAQTL